MSNHITQPASMVEVVRDHVRKNILAAIPDEQIDALVRAEWSAFFEEKSPQYGAPATSPFKEMVKVEIREFVRERFKETLKRELEATWNSDTQRNEVAVDLVNKIKPVIYDAILEDSARALLSSIRSNIQRF